MPLISEFRKGRICIGSLSANSPTLARASIDATGTPSNIGTGGNDLILINDTSSTIVGDFKANRIWNAVWNDVADFQKLAGNLEYGKCYFDTAEGAQICNTRCQKSAIGIASDTFGFGVGSNNPDSGGKEVPIAVAGWTLAYVDATYEPGSVLTNDSQGNLTKMSYLEKLLHPERILAIYKKKEIRTEFGTEKKTIAVKGRHWVKVK